MLTAFPVSYDCGRSTGMTLRDYFAAHILPEIYSQLHEFPEDWRLGLAKDAYKMADAMLKAREQ